MLDFIEPGLGITHKIKYTSVAHIRNKQLCTVENKPNHLYCSVNSMTETRIRDHNTTK